MGKKKTRVHKIINGQLLQMDKKFSHLEQRQKERINEWLYQEYRSIYVRNDVQPDSRYDEDVLCTVQEKISEAKIWLPFEELCQYYYSRKNRFRNRYERELERVNAPASERIDIPEAEDE